MKWLLDITTQAKLLLSFGLIIILMIGMIIITYLSMKTIQESEQTLFDKDFTIALDLAELRAELNFQRSKILEMTITSNKSVQETLAQEIKEHIKVIDENIKNITNEEQINLRHIDKINELKSILITYRQTREIQVNLIFEGKIDEARQLSATVQNERFDKIQSIVLELVKETEEKAKAAVVESEERVKQTISILSIVGIITVFIAIAITLLLSRVIANPLKEISVIAEKVASGDLTTNIVLNNRQDEVGVLIRAFYIMVNSLQRLTKDIDEGINLLASATSEILAATKQVATSTAETGVTIAQTTTTVEEVKQTSQLSSQKAKYVSENAQKISQVSLSGKKSVEQLIGGMNKIKQQMEFIAESIVKLSEQNQTIGEITATVNDLAEQSNLLAVNAAIEAAKAGEQGRGFSVVAQEVKSLAEQSKQATTQIRTILRDIQKATATAVMATEQGSKAVEIGAKQSIDAGESIRILTESIVESSQAATQIAASSQQQLVGMDQVALAMDNIKQASMQNISGTKQTEIAAQNLYQLGQKLKQIAECYKL